MKSFVKNVDFYEFSHELGWVHYHVTHYYGFFEVFHASYCAYLRPAYASQHDNCESGGVKSIFMVVFVVAVD